MKKLKLEELVVTSFETASAARARGTVLGAANTAVRPCEVPFETYDIQDCGDTQYFDCTYGCSQNTGCPNGCIEA